MFLAWANSDDDDGDGATDGEQIGAPGEVVAREWDDDLYEVSWSVDICGDATCALWTIDGGAGARIWYVQNPDADDLSNLAVSPWTAADIRHIRIGETIYHEFPAGRLMRGHPYSAESRFFIEVLQAGDAALVFSLFPAGRADWERQGILRIAALEMDVLDLRGWGPTIVPPQDTPALQFTNLSSNAPPVPGDSGWRVGGALTDGASICMLRLKRPQGAGEYEAIDGVAVDVVKRVQSGTVELGMRAGGALHSAYGALLPPLPAAESHPQFLGARSLVMSEGRVFYVPPESYLDPAHNPSLGEDSLNGGETCVIAFRARLGTAYIGGSRGFILRRPPIVLVHGILSSPATWGSQAYSEALGVPVPTRLYFADYSATATKGYSENFHVVPETISQALLEYRTGDIHGARTNPNARPIDRVRFAATRVDVIGHSMGGQLVRTYVSSLDFSVLGTLNRTRNGTPTAWEPVLFLRTGTFGDRRYIRPDNWGAGDIRRFVPIGSPFRGSSLANRVEPVLEPTNDNLTIQALVFDRGLLPGVRAFLYPNGYPGYYRQPTCIPDLCEGSMVQGHLAGWWEYPSEHRTIQMRPLVGIALQPASGGVFAGTPFDLFFGFALAVGASPALPEPIGLSGGDLIVHKYSQGNEDDEVGYTRPRGPIEFDGHTHLNVGAPFSAETESTRISQEIGRLLSTPTSVINGGVLHE